MTTTLNEPTETDAVETDARASEPPVKKRSNLVPALILAVGMVAAAYLLKPETTSPTPPEPAEEQSPGPVVGLDPLTLNLSDGKFIRIGVAIELTEDADVAAFEEHGAATRLQDLVIFEVTKLDSESVTGSARLEALKSTLSSGAAELYGDDFHGLYLTDLVIQ